MSTSLYEDVTPEEVKNAKGLHLLTMNTPNGQKAQIMLEELKELYGTEWTKTLINITTKEQKKEWYLRLDPNGRIPLLVDNNESPPHPVMESSAILLYLQSAYDTNGELGFKNKLEQSQALQWLFFWHGSKTNLAQMVHYVKRAKETIPYSIERFTKESSRILGVLELHLSGKYTNQPRDYLAGNGKGKYSVADIVTWPWISQMRHQSHGITQEQIDQFPHLLNYIDRIAERPAVKRGIGKDYEE